MTVMAFIKQVTTHHGPWLLGTEGIFKKKNANFHSLCPILKEFVFLFRPVDDSFSLMVMLVMAVGLGVPTLVLILGGTGIAIRNYRQRKDDLLN